MCATGLYIPELRITFEAGAIVSCQKPDVILVSHSHSDHSICLSRMLSHSHPPTVFVPQETVPFVERFISASRELSCHTLSSEVPLTENHRLVGALPGNVYMLPGGRTMHPIRCFHSVPCLGYAIYQGRQKLKAEFTGLPGAEIATFRKSGVDVTESVELPLLAFLGDTTAQVFESPLLDNMPLVICECTFLWEEHRSNAVSTKHTFWGDLQAIVHGRPLTTFVLIHFSARYSNAEIRAFFSRAENMMPNIVLFIPL